MGGGRRARGPARCDRQNVRAGRSVTSAAVCRTDGAERRGGAVLGALILTTEIHFKAFGIIFGGMAVPWTAVGPDSCPAVLVFPCRASRGIASRMESSWP